MKRWTKYHVCKSRWISSLLLSEDLLQLHLKSTRDLPPTSSGIWLRPWFPMFVSSLGWNTLKRECRQRTVTDGIGARTLGAVGKEDEETKLFITTIPFSLGTWALETVSHWWPVWWCATSPHCCPQLRSPEEHLKCNLGEICCNLLSCSLYL